MKLIDKDALVAEIERRLEALSNTSAGDNRNFAAIIGAQYYELKKLTQYIDTLEVKEADLEKEFDNYTKNISASDVQFEPFTQLYNCAKYFFELGLKTQGE